MDKKWHDRLKQQFGKYVYFDQPDEEQDLRWVGVNFESRLRYCNTPAELMRRLGEVGLVQGQSEEGPKFELAGYSSIQTGPTGLRFYVTLEDISAPLDSEKSQ